MQELGWVVVDDEGPVYRLLCRTRREAISKFRQWYWGNTWKSAYEHGFRVRRARLEVVE